MNWNAPTDNGDKKEQLGDLWRNYFGADLPKGKNLLLLIVVGVLVIWGALGVYQLDQQERAVVLRLGKFNSVVQPGLRWNPPIVDRVIKVNVTKLYSENFSGYMLTRFENIVDVKISVQYRVSDPKLFVLKVREPIQSLRHAMESALRHVVGGSQIDEVITFGREQVAQEVKERLQSYLDLYQTGIEVLQVNINEADPPQEVKEAFDDVNKALEDEARYKNEAEAYANEIVPRARGQALRVKAEAEAYRQQVISRADGETRRFSQLLAQYERAPEVTRRRLYLVMMEEVLSNTSKVLIDVKDGNSLFYLPLDKIFNETLQAARDLPRTDSEKDKLAEDLAQRILRELSSRQNFRRGAVR